MWIYFQYSLEKVIIFSGVLQNSSVSFEAFPIYFHSKSKGISILRCFSVMVFHLWLLSIRMWLQADEKLYKFFNSLESLWNDVNDKRSTRDRTWGSWTSSQFNHSNLRHSGLESMFTIIATRKHIIFFFVFLWNWI